MSEVLLSMEHITKIYTNGFVANKDVFFQVNKGEIHALSGENGAGKSTLMKILFGEEKAEKGRIIYKGKELKLENSTDAIKSGIGMVHQHFMLVPSFTVAENMVLGSEPGRFGHLDKRAAKRMTMEISQAYNLIVDPDKHVCELSVAERQKVEILKALLRGAELLILDEPTAVLTPQETAELFEQILRLKEKGHTIIFISHKLKEIRQICQRITVLRNGRTMGTDMVENLTDHQISKLMVGRDVMLQLEKEAAKPGDITLSIRDLKLSPSPEAEGVSFDLRSGEILGIAGVEGNGQTQLADAISGLAEYSTGSIKLNGTELKGKSILERREMGLSHVSEDRMTCGCSADANVVENLFSTSYYKKEYSKFGLLDRKLMRKRAWELVKEYRIKCRDLFDPVRMLSGGNIQKVVVAREFSGQTKCMLANQPTRGIDVGATELIRKKLIQFRDEGVAELLISADLNEVLELSDSLIVLHNSQICAYFPDASKVDELELGQYMLGIKSMSKEEVRRAVHEE